MEHYQAKGVMFMIVVVLFYYSIGMVEQDNHTSDNNSDVTG